VGGRVKLAVGRHALGVSRDEAERRLAEAGGVIRRVVRAAPPPVM
jgi:N-acetylmuramic acid 6-phosphate (MurNAc-6-P) etherase